MASARVVGAGVDIAGAETVEGWHAAAAWDEVGLVGCVGLVDFGWVKM